MIIAPTTTPVALLDQNSVNQSQQQQVQSTEYSRKASVTVQLSSEARELAGTENKEAPLQQKAEAQITKQVNAAVETTKQQPVNPTSKQPENNKISILV